MKAQPTLGCCIAILGIASCSAAAVKPRATDLCTLVSRPAEFDHQVVQVRATVQSDGIEHTGLIDDACQGKGVALSISNESAARPDVKQLVDAIFHQGRMGTIGKHITATVSGTFLSRPGNRPSRELILESVSNLKVSSHK